MLAKKGKHFKLFLHLTLYLRCYKRRIKPRLNACAKIVAVFPKHNTGYFSSQLSKMPKGKLV